MNHQHKSTNTTPGNVRPQKHKGLIVFDIEGVLLPKRRYLLFETTEKVGLWGFIRIIWLGILYEIGLTSLETSLKGIFQELRGLTMEEVLQLFKRVPLMPGVIEVFETLRNAGYQTALISSGLPRFLVEDLAVRLQADYARGLELEVEEKKITGRITGDVLKQDGKGRVLHRILREENTVPQRCVVVADDRNNLSMFPHCKQRIGYNPDFLLSVKADFVVRENLTEILPLIEDTLQICDSPPPRSKKIRHIVHISGFSIPIMSRYLLANAYTHLISLFILLVTLLYIASEVAKLKRNDFPIFSTITRKAATNPELYEFATAPIFFALGITFTLILFPPHISYASIAVLTLGDGFASIFGGKFGKTRVFFNKGKNVEGSIFGFIFAFLGATLFIDPLKAIIGAAIGMLVESLPLPISDNLMVPIIAGLTLTLIS